MDRAQIGFIALGLAGLGGCGGTAPAPLRALPLSAPLVARADGPALSSQVEMTATGNLSPASSHITLPASALHLMFKTGERPRLELLELPLADATVPASSLPPKGLALRDLRLTIPRPVDAEVLRSDDDTLELRATAPLQMTWAMVLDDGSLYPLGPAHTAPLELDVSLVRAGGSLTATVTAHCDGSCWSLDGITDLRDGSLWAEGAADVTPAP